MPSIVEIFQQYGVAHEVDREWVNCPCPFCGGTAPKLGYNQQQPHFFCWRCGWHSIDDTLIALCGLPVSTARELSRSLRGETDGALLARRDREVQVKVQITSYKHPSDTGPMRTVHLRYLARRGFDPERIRKEWNVGGTGPAAWLDNIDYRHRLFIPIYWDGKEVSFQTRDVTGKSEIRYRACPTPREVMHYKYLIYGNPEGWRDRLGIAVEGVTDCWRLGSRAFAVFGIQYRTEQVMQITKHFDRVAVIFDSDKQARKQARKLSSQLQAANIATTNIELGPGEDPGSISYDDAKHLVRSIERWGRTV